MSPLTRSSIAIAAATNAMSQDEAAIRRSAGMLQMIKAVTDPMTAATIAPSRERTPHTCYPEHKGISSV